MDVVNAGAAGNRQSASERMMHPVNIQAASSSDASPIWDKYYALCDIGFVCVCVHISLPIFYVLWIFTAVFYSSGDVSKWLGIFICASLFHCLSTGLAEYARAAAVNRLGVTLPEIVICPFGAAEYFNADLGIRTLKGQLKVFLIGISCYILAGIFWVMMAAATGGTEWGVLYPVRNHVPGNICNTLMTTTFYMCLLNSTVPIYPFGIAQLAVSFLLKRQHAASSIGKTIFFWTFVSTFVWFVIGCLNRSFLLIFATFWNSFQLYLLWVEINEETFHNHPLCLDAADDSKPLRTDSIDRDWDPELQESPVTVEYDEEFNGNSRGAKNSLR